jgi:uncharacterized protein
MKPERVKLGVQGVAMDPGDSTPVIILKEVGGLRSLPVMVGPAEASAIIMELEGLKPVRPMTHDLIIKLFAAHGFRITEARLFGASGDSYLARIHYRRGLARFRMDLRPSDCIALAVRSGAPLYADGSLLRSAPALNYFGLHEADERREIYYVEPEWRPRQSL